MRANCDVGARLAVDPVGFVRRYEDPLDRELVGLVAACVAFGNVKTIRRKLEEIFRRVEGSAEGGTSRTEKRDPPHLRAEDAEATKRALRGFRHRVFVGDDIARLLIGARIVQKKHGTLGARMSGLLSSCRGMGGAERPIPKREELEGRTPLEQDRQVLREALARLCDEIREAGGVRSKHLLADPRAGSSVKRLVLWVKWMTRPDDGIDLGLWHGVPTSALVIPVDVHIHKLSRNLGLTARKDASWKTAAEITAALARLDREDPTKYDFSLCHMGMLQRCPSRRDPKRCDGCPVKPVCIHWSK